jgi:hypothetical protein
MIHFLCILVELKAALQRVSAAATTSAVKRTVADVAQLLCNSQRGLQGLISGHLVAVAEERYLGSMSTVTEADKLRKRAFVSGLSTEAAAAVYVFAPPPPQPFDGLGVPLQLCTQAGGFSFPGAREGSKVSGLPPAHPDRLDYTRTSQACGRQEAQTQRTKLHTAMEIATCRLLIG